MEQRKGKDRPAGKLKVIMNPVSLFSHQGEE
jgi:hypothetical protein